MMGNDVKISTDTDSVEMNDVDAEQGIARNKALGSAVVGARLRRESLTVLSTVEDIRMRIYDYLIPEDLVTLSKTCREMNRLVATSDIWRKKLRIHFNVKERRPNLMHAFAEHYISEYSYSNWLVTSKLLFSLVKEGDLPRVEAWCERYRENNAAHDRALLPYIHIDRSLRSLMQHAMLKGRKSILKFFLEEFGAPPTRAVLSYLFSIALHNNLIEFAQLLRDSFDFGNEDDNTDYPNQLFNLEFTEFEQAILRADFDAVQRMLDEEQGQSKLVRSVTNLGLSMLHLAAIVESVDIARLLLERGAPAAVFGTRWPYSYWESLQTAVEQGNLALVKLIVNYIKRPSGHTRMKGLIRLAKEMHHIEVLTYLAKVNDDPFMYRYAVRYATYPLTPLQKSMLHFHTIIHNVPSPLRELSELPTVDPNEDSPNGLTALHYAAIFGRSPMALSIFSDINPNQPSTEDGLTPLHFAGIFNHPAAVRALMKFPDLELSPKSNTGHTPARVAWANGHRHLGYFIWKQSKKQDLARLQQRATQILHHDSYRQLSQR